MPGHRVYQELGIIFILEWAVDNKPFLAFVFCIATSFCACRSVKSGPKLIDADGISYFACNGALWLLNEGNPKDPGERSYYVSFKDAQGVTH